MANQFSIAPAGDYLPGLSGLSDVLQNVGKQRKEEALIENAKQRGIDAKNKLLGFIKTGDADGAMALSIEYPEFAQQLGQEASRITGVNDKDRMEFMASLLGKTPEEAAQLYHDRADMLLSQGKDAQHTLRSYAELTATPERKMKENEVAFATLYPEQYKAYKSATEPKAYQLGKNEVVKDASGKVIASNFIEDPIERKTAQDVNGALRYVDNGSLVFPGVQKETKASDRKTAQDVNGALRYIDDGSLVFPDIRKELSQKELDALSAEEKNKESLIQQTKDANAYIDNAMALIDDSYSGYSGAIAASVSPTGTNAQLRRALTTIKANIGFDKLMEMKRNSPTGGALGQVSEKELEYLQATLGSLDAKSDSEELKAVLNHVRSVYDRINRGAGGSGISAIPDFSNMSTDELLQKLGGQ